MIFIYYLISTEDFNIDILNRKLIIGLTSRVNSSLNSAAISAQSSEENSNQDSICIGAGTAAGLLALIAIIAVIAILIMKRSTK